MKKKKKEEEKREVLPSTQSRASEASLAGRVLHNWEINFLQNNLHRSPVSILKSTVLHFPCHKTINHDFKLAGNLRTNNKSLHPFPTWY